MILLLLGLSVAFAGEREEAEHQRLSSEMTQMAQRQSWAGVEKTYEELEKLAVDMTFDDLMHGAYAARALGDVQDAYQRLKSAAKINGTKEIVDWLYTIDANYGHVDLVATPPRGVELACAELPFDPDMRVAVQAAMEEVKSAGTFSGLLPRGAYVYAGQPFSVEPGIAVKIEVSPRLKKTQGEVVNVTTTPTWGSGSDSGAPAPAPTPPPP